MQVEAKAEAGKEKKPLTLAYVFQAQKQEVYDDFEERVQRELIDEHNAECVDIAKEHEELKKGNQARANNKKRARILRLVALKQKVIGNLKIEFLGKMLKVIEELGGKVVEREDHDRKVRFAEFPDGTSDRIPNGPFIPFDKFQKA